MIRRPGVAELPAVLAGAGMLAWSVGFVGPWVLLVGLGVLATAVTPLRWPGTAAAIVVLLVVAAAGPSVTSALVTGLLITAYLVLVDGPPPRRGLLALGVGVALAVLVMVGALAVSVLLRPAVWWVLAGALAAPVVLVLAGSGNRTGGGIG